MRLKAFGNRFFMFFYVFMKFYVPGPKYDAMVYPEILGFHSGEHQKLGISRSEEHTVNF